MKVSAKTPHLNVAYLDFELEALLNKHTAPRLERSSFSLHKQGKKREWKTEKGAQIKNKNYICST